MSTLAIEKATDEVAIMLMRGDDPRDIMQYAQTAFEKLSAMEREIVVAEDRARRESEAKAHD